MNLPRWKNTRTQVSGARHQSQAFRVADRGWTPRKFPRPPVDGELFSLTSPFIEQGLALTGPRIGLLGRQARHVLLDHLIQPGFPPSSVGPGTASVVTGLGSCSSWAFAFMLRHSERMRAQCSGESSLLQTTTRGCSTIAAIAPDAARRMYGTTRHPALRSSRRSAPAFSLGFFASQLISLHDSSSTRNTFRPQSKLGHQQRIREYNPKLKREHARLASGMVALFARHLKR